ncbi:MAG TPA: hypothetical protein VFF02_03175 [Anaeromyxobacteraceae bacterium]|nr:hypothetical protein [Anaeromyxobacteraceae bacterium]
MIRIVNLQDRGMDGRSIFSRRRFLGIALGAGGAVLMGGGALAWLRGRAPPVAGLRCLSDHEYRTLRQLALALFPRQGGFSVGAEDLDLARSFDGFLADEPDWNRGDLKKGLFLLEYGPVVFEGRAVTFSHLPAPEGLAHFERWVEGGLVRRQLALALRRFLALVFYDRPEVWPYIGYEGPLVQ